MGMAVVLRQGLWAWMILVSAQRTDETSASPVSDVLDTTSAPACPPADWMCHELVAACTNLLVGAVTRQELQP